MSKQQSATLPHCDPKRGRDKSTNVITIRIFKRKGSKLWQALVKCGKWSKRVSTRTVIKPSAEEFAVLAFRHLSRLAADHKLPVTKRRESASC
jgi:hypothetical protein